MGKFDRLARGEKAEDRASARGKKRKFLPTADKVGAPSFCDWLAAAQRCVSNSLGERTIDWDATLVPHVQGGAERQLASKAVDRILAANADDIVDVKRAIGKFEVSRRGRGKCERGDGCRFFPSVGWPSLQRGTGVVFAHCAWQQSM